MRPIFAKWSQHCAHCGGLILMGAAAIYDDNAKKLYHADCAPVEPSTPTPDIAAACGFVDSRDASVVNWVERCAERK